MQAFFQYKNLAIAYTKVGAGKVVVLLHGFGEDATIWNNQVDFLKAYFTVITIDLPGSGKSKTEDSTLNNNNELSTIDYYADIVNALLANITIEKFTMLGHSMGGYITLAFAEKYSEKLYGFGLIHSTAYADTEEKKTNRQRSIEMLEQYGSYAFLKTSIPTLFTTAFKSNHPSVVEDLLEKATTLNSFPFSNKSSTTLG